MFYIGIATVLACCAAASAWQALAVASDIEWQKRASSLVHESNALLSSIETAETGQRGYLLTEDKSYLEPYYAGKKRADEALARLSALMVRPDQVAALLPIRSDMRAKFEELALTVRLAETGHRAQALDVVRTNAGRDYMERLRRGIGAVTTGCEAKRNALIRDEEVRVRMTGYAFVGLLLSVVAMLVFAAALQKKVFARVLQGNRRMTRAASRDPLTGLANRRELDRRLLELSAGGNAGVAVTALFIDLDGFKSVNDTLGHATGDLLLRDVSRALRDATRPGDIIARVGGDEFIVVAAGLTEAQQVDALCERLIDAVGGLGTLYGPVGLSVGVATGTLDGTAKTSDRLLQKADQAMYAVKRSGGGYTRGGGHASAAPHSRSPKQLDEDVASNAVGNG